jgi:cytochrome oxidase Cu insertion factor (SCO1/SenC/PrrC family)
MRRKAPVPPGDPAAAGVENQAGGGGQVGGPDPEGAAARRRVRQPVVAVAVSVAVLAAVLASFLVFRHQRQQELLARLRPSGIPASVSTPLALQMQLSPVPARQAPGFTLTDQRGRSISLASLKGHAVVLEFMDPHCTDICPIVSQEFIEAYRDLGAAARHAVFIAVNVNPYYRSVASMASYSAEQHLGTIPSWHFLTGALPSLRAVWSDYQIAVEAPSRNADIVHTSLAYFIDPSGRERFVAVPMDDHTATGKSYLPASSLASWARGIALVTASLTR